MRMPAEGDAAMSSHSGHVVLLTGARNLRDIGGYTAGEGRRVCYGRVFRGGHPLQNAAAARAAVDQLGLAAICDLRSNAERSTRSWPRQAVRTRTYWSRDYQHSDGDLYTLLRSPNATVAAVQQAMVAAYQRLPYEQSEAVHAVFQCLLRGDTPLLIHCSAGKDRTGIVVALLLTVLGVSRTHILEDYELTAHFNPPAEARLEWDGEGAMAFLRDVPGDVWAAVMGAPAAYMNTMFATLEAEHGSPEAFLAEIAHVGEREITHLRRSLTEPYS
jgi:protein-tyrosine phosphatase